LNVQDLTDPCEDTEVDPLGSAPDHAKRYNAAGSDDMYNRRYMHSHPEALLLSPEQLSELAMVIHAQAPREHRESPYTWRPLDHFQGPITCGLPPLGQLSATEDRIRPDFLESWQEVAP
jgi:hypothetical protein